MKSQVWGAALRKTAQLLAIAAVLLLALCITPRGAMAHAEVASSTPAGGSSVQAGLTEITITFDEEISVDQSTAALTGPGGGPMSGVRASVSRTERTKMTIKTPALTAGQYTVNWTAVTEDDNGVANGTLSFTVASGASGPAIPSASNPSQSGAGMGGRDMGGSGSRSLPRSGAGDAPAVLFVLLTCAMFLAATGLTMRRRAGASE